MECFSFLQRKKIDPSARQKVQDNQDVSEISNTKLFTYKELRLATENFSQSNKIGEGGFGSVYKGKLKNGTMAAMKVLSDYSRQGVREFLTEINLIAGIEHENLVKLYGCCVEGDHRILVYGYLMNNSLARVLRGGGHSGVQLSWNTRQKICIGVAKGLAFLHEEIQPRIIHRDIKASNILLDENFNPKISDFGLAKLFPQNMTHLSTRVAGTTGYLAPEYAIRGQLTRKADVYSFGVLLLEIVSGRPSINRGLPKREQFLLERAWEKHEAGHLVELVDSTLAEDFDNEEACRYLRVGLLCTQEGAKLRPSMPTVVKMLRNKINVNAKEIGRPGLFSESFDDTKKNDNDTASTSLGKSLVSSEPTSHADMTFASIFDRSD